MRDPKITLKHLSSLKENQTVTNLYKHLYNPEFYKIAYNNIYSKSSQNSTIDRVSEEKINRLIQSLRNKTYQPTLLRKVNISKKDGKTRPISIPSLNDKLVQEIIRMILEALWEPHFLNCSHSFRPNRSCHTALKYTQQKFRGTKWWIEADIKGCFDDINHEILLNLLKKRIREQKFIHLINLFLKAGYIENWQYHKTYSGTPQGSIISPILVNIYLHEFDKYMNDMISKFNIGKKRKTSPEYHRLESQVRRAKNSLKKGNTTYHQLKLKKENLRNFINRNGYLDQFDSSFKRLAYVRYADDFIIGIIGSKTDSLDIMNKVKEFLEVSLKLNNQKTKIIHNSEKVHFLGYEISVMKSIENRRINGGIALWLPYEVMKNFIIDNRFGKFVCDSKTGKPKLKAIHRSELINLDELKILMQYNIKIRGLYNYYKMASNVCKMNGFNYICQVSFLKTLANKYKISCAKLYKNINYNHRMNGVAHIGITYNNKFYNFFNGPFNVVKNIDYVKDLDNKPNSMKYSGRESLISRHKKTTHK